METFSSYQQRFIDLSQNTSSDNASRGMILINDSLRYLTEKYYFNEETYTTPTVAMQQAYQLPYNVKDIINLTVLVGGILWQPLESPNRQAWDSYNTIPFYSDFPQFYYRYTANQVNLFPIPTSNGNTLTIHYKKRILNLSATDYADGTVAVTKNSATVTGTTTAWTTNMKNRWLNIPETTNNTTSGDNEWYQIASVESTTSLTLYNKYVGENASTAGYTIGDVPILPEDYQDLALYRALWIYYTSIVPNLNQAKAYNALYMQGKEILDEEFSSKSTSPVLTDPYTPTWNPNAFPRVT